MSEPKPTLDPIGYRCDGCGRLFRDPWADLSAIRSAGGLSCCPERKPVGISALIQPMLDAAYRAALEDAAALVMHHETVPEERLTVDDLTDRIRALTPPADLAERVKGLSHE